LSVDATGDVLVPLVVAGFAVVVAVVVTGDVGIVVVVGSLGVVVVVGSFGTVVVVGSLGTVVVVGSLGRVVVVGSFGTVVVVGSGTVVVVSVGSAVVSGRLVVGSRVGPGRAAKACPTQIPRASRNPSPAAGFMRLQPRRGRSGYAPSPG
jgi:hypothetical protein